MKTAIVTGGAGGIGSAIVKRLCREGCSVAINYRTSEEKAEALSSLLNCEGYDVFTVQADVSVPAEAKKLVDTVVARNGSVDILVNNAGVEYWGLFSDMTDGDIARVTAADFTAPHLMCREVIPYMVKNKQGRIVNISSVWGQCGASCEVMYSSAKAGIIGLTKALSQELAPSGITVNCVAPGAIKTSMLDRFSPDELAAFCEDVPVGRLGTPEEVAAAVAFFAADENSYITGQVLGVNGGML